MTIHAAVFALLALLLPAAAFLVLAIAAPVRRAGRPAAYVSILCAAGALLSAAQAWRLAEGAGVPPAAGAARLLWPWLPMRDGVLATIGVFADTDSTIMLVLVALVALLVQVYSFGYLSGETPAALGRYYTYQSLFAFSMMGLVLAPNFLQLFICWELVGLCSYLLIGFWYHKPEAARAAVKAFWITKAGDVGLLTGIVLLWRHAGTFDFVDLRAMANSGELPVVGLSLITFLIYLGAVGKSAQFPLHVWLPDAMEGPTPVSALIHAATMVTAGVYMLVRTEWLFALTPEVLAVVAWIGAFTALMAATLACAQDDIKRVLAYSTVSQLGYMMAAIGAGFAAAGFFHLLTHGVFKALLFLAAGAVIHAVHSNNLSHMGGLARRMPQTAIVFLVGTLSLAGIPFFGGFLSKEEVLGAVWAGGHAGPFVLLMAAAFLTAFYMFRVVFLAFFGVPAPGTMPNGVGVGAMRASPFGPSNHALDAHGEGSSTTAVGPHDPPATMLAPVWVLALLAMGVGLSFASLHAEPSFASPPWLMPAAVGVAVAGIALAWLAYERRAIEPGRLAALVGPIRQAVLARLWVDDLFEAAYRAGILGLARTVGWIDRYMVDGVVNAVSAWTLEAGDDMRSMQTGRVQDYVYGVAMGLLAIVLWISLVLS
ncbi:MAG TPA: NADH-quinone oxidoreductase subunit L [Vicinamibacterales bacterium]|nr:NADH-quinone oxidoreductase subunit L [Vicinamibacterales bacterium]